MGTHLECLAIWIEGSSRGTGQGISRVEELSWYMGNGVIKSHKSQTKPQYARWKAVQVFQV